MIAHPIFGQLLPRGAGLLAQGTFDAHPMVRVFRADMRDFRFKDIAGKSARSRSRSGNSRQIEDRRRRVDW